jgi:hypothetical protein
MHCTTSIRSLLLGTALAVVTLAGPPLVCHKWVSSPGSLFETLEPLRAKVMEADDGPAQKEAALRELAALRAAIRPGDALSYMKAGYWAAALHSIRVSTAVDGPELIEQAVRLRPDDAEYHYIAALAYLSSDKSQHARHWQRAVELAKPGSAVERNLRELTPPVSAHAR